MAIIIGPLSWEYNTFIFCKHLDRDLDHNVDEFSYCW